MTLLVKYLVVVLLVGAVCGEDEVVQEDDSEDNIREIREFNPEGWKAVKIFPESDFDWVPRTDAQDSDNIKPKRRRLRKRKRRPPLSESANGEDHFPRRRIRPYRLEQINQPWEEMEDENIKPNNRRRLPLPYPSLEEVSNETNGTENIITERKDSEEKPLGASIMVVEKPEPHLMQSSVADLKNLLKQSGGKLSLSEILQQKNLSLSELLQGNGQAISALTENPQKVTLPSETNAEQSTKYKRLPPSIGLKSFNRNIVSGEQTEILTEKETLEAQRKRLSLLQSKEQKILANVIKFEVFTDSTTEKRIFVPTNIQEVVEDDTNDREIVTTTERKTTSSSTLRTTVYTTPSTTATTEEIKENTNPTTKIVRFRGKLPTTNAKLRFTTKKVKLIEKEHYPLSSELPKPIKIDINEVLGITNENNNKQKEIISIEEKTEGPMRVSIDLETMFENESKKALPSFEKIPKSVFKEPELTTNGSEEQNETYVTAKQEIMEVMKDPISRVKLSRILEHRNMTLEELVEQRERGSSQLHLADIFHNKTREPEPKEAPSIGHINTEIIHNFRQQKSTKLDESTNVSSTGSPTSAMNVVTTKQKDIFPTVTVKIIKNSNEGLDTFPWKQLYPDLFPPSTDNGNVEIAESYNEVIQRIDLESSLLSEPDEGFFASIPSGVKSAIFVSLAIIGLSIAVFLAILVVFKWAQRKNRSMNYCSSLATRFRSPIMLQGGPTTAIKTFMNETLRRKKNYYKSSLQSMSDEIWDANRERKESF